MATTDKDSTSLPVSSEMASAMVFPKPLASIFTKEGLQKCKEQQSLPKPRRSRKKEPAGAPAITPPDSAQETTSDLSTTKQRGRPENGTPKEAASKPKSIATSKAKGKRKQKDDGEAEFRIRGPASKTTLATLTRAASKAEEQNTSAQVSSTNSEVGSEVGMATVDYISETLVDPNHSRRKRRKKSPHSQTEEVASPVGTNDADDIVMEDSPTVALMAVDGHLPEVSQVIGDLPPISTIVRAVETAQGPPEIPTAKIQDATEPQKHLPIKPLHPFFTPGGAKKPEVEVKEIVKAVHPFFAPGGMKKPKAVPKTNARTILPILSSVPQPPKETKAMVVITSVDSVVRSVVSPTTRTALKVSGGMEAPWPDKQQRHVRQLAPTDFVFPRAQSSTPYRQVRKLKAKRVEVSQGEDLLDNLAKSLGIAEYKNVLSRQDYNAEQFFRVSSTLRLPTRRILTGLELQNQLRRSIIAKIPPSVPIIRRVKGVTENIDDLGQFEPKDSPHPALLRLFNNLHDAVSPFDLGLPETTLWTHKYAPQHSSEVLQVGPELTILRDWVCKLMVDTGYEVAGIKKKRKAKGKDGAAPTSGKGGKRKSKKRRAKGDGLDNFLVDSEEEESEMDEITDPEDNGDVVPPPICGTQTKKSAIRTSGKNATIAAQLGYPSGGGPTTDGRMVNAVVISGPYGCGKTAAVYAVAKEMGFTVFEVNAGTRRSGKDLLDQVGEMSRNHLVHQQKANFVDVSCVSKQGKKQKAQQIEAVIEKAQQTQSLILLEEADLLFEEDKQFWPTVMALMARSKRPIVMTCNDEELLPIEDLSLYAILRMTPPPRALAIDYLLLMAANEGHLLAQGDLVQLYKCHKGDLRAMIMELHFWCQMGIGDKKAGLTWILPRTSAECGIDEHGGGLKRVLSDHTYFSGMGWFPSKEADDGVSAPQCPGRRLREEDIWKETWDDWGIDVAVDGCGQMRGMEDWMEGLSDLKTPKEKALVRDAFEIYAEALSDVDIYAGSAMREINDPVLDWTQPRRPASSRADDLLGYPVKQTDIWPANHTSRDILTSMAITVRSLARSHLASATNHIIKPPLNDGFSQRDSSPPRHAPIDPITELHITEMISARVPLAQEIAPLPSSYLRGAFLHLTIPPSAFLTSHPTSSPGTTIITSTIYGPLDTLITDVAPYVRSIIRHEMKREEEAKASTLLSQAGKGAKRNTRASRLAMMANAGRSWGRKERWFGQRGNVVWMGKTGGDGWGRAVEEVMERREGLVDEGGES